MYSGGGSGDNSNSGSHTREQVQDPAGRLGYGDSMSPHDQSIGVTVDDRCIL